MTAHDPWPTDRTHAAASVPPPTIEREQRTTRRFSVAPSFGSHWVIMDGFVEMDAEAYPSADLAEGRAAYLNSRILVDTVTA